MWMRTPSASLLSIHASSRNRHVSKLATLIADRPDLDTTKHSSSTYDGGGAHPRLKFPALPGNSVTSSRRRRILLFRFELKKEEEEREVLIGDDLFRYIYQPVVKRRIQSNRFSSTFEFRGNECIECAPSPRRSSVSNERESYLITNVWGVLETTVDREVKYRFTWRVGGNNFIELPNGWNSQFCHSSSWWWNIKIEVLIVCIFVYICVYKDRRNEKSTVRSFSKLLFLKIGLHRNDYTFIFKRTLIRNNHLTKLKVPTITFYETWPSSWSDYLKGSL